MTPVRTIVHLSDLHFGRVDREIVDALVRTVAFIAPQVVVVSGDFTQRARAEQFKEARAFLDALRIPTVVVPGNHDIPLHNVFARFVTPLAGYRRYITSDLTPRYTDSETPPGLVIVGTDTTRSFTVGGGVRTLQDAGAIFDAGADKISINSAAIADPSLITCIAQRFGSQAVIVAIDAKQNGNGFQAWIAGGRVASGKDAVAWAKEAEDRGAGEILLTSIDRDGTKIGFDCRLTAAVSSAVSIPVIASGGAGTLEHFTDVFTTGRADAALAASIFHYAETSVHTLKQHLKQRGIPVRL